MKIFEGDDIYCDTCELMIRRVGRFDVRTQGV